MENTPPMVSGGLPVLGHALQMMNDSEKLFKRGFEAHGEIFAIKLGPGYAAVTGNPDHQRFIFSHTDKELNISDVYSFLNETFGEIFFTAGPEAYMNQRPILQALFTREKMAEYAHGMNIEIQKWLDGLGDSGEMDISEEMLHLTQYVAGRAFVGDNFRDELGEEFWQAYADLSNGLDPILPSNLPLPKFAQARRGRDRIREIFTEVVARRAQNPNQYDDLVTQLMNTPLKDGTYLDEEGVVSIFMGLLFAGHETTAGQAAWTIILLHQNPEYLALVQDEIAEHVVLGSEITGRELRHLTHVYWAIDETTRLRPSAHLLMRLVEEPVQLGEYTIPEGWRIILSSQISHHHTDYFTNTDTFDPLRYSPERDEGKHSAVIMGFGGGLHKCTGMNFAKNEMAIIVTHLLQQFEIELVTQNPHVIMGKGASRPSSTIVRYRRKATASELTPAGEVAGITE